MAVQSALVLDTAGPLQGIPASGEPILVPLDTGGFALVAESLNQSILVVYDSDGQVSWSKAFMGTSPSVIQSSTGSLVIQTETNVPSQGTYSLTELDLTGAVLNTASSSFGADVTAYDLHETATGLFGMSIVSEFATDSDLQFNAFSALNTSTVLARIDNIVATSSTDLSTAVLSNGEVLTAFTLETVSTGDTVVAIESYDSTGTQQIGFDIDFFGNPGEVSDPSVVAFNGGFAIAFVARPFSFIASTDIFLQIYDNAGNLQATENVSNPGLSLTFIDDGSDDSDPHLSVGSDGTLVVSYTRNNDGVSDQMVYVYTEQGTSSTQIGFGTDDNEQTNGQVVVFGDGDIAYFYVDEDTGFISGEVITGERDTAGDENDNRLMGDNFADLMNGLGGNDTVNGGNGNDTLQGGDGDDMVFGGEGNDSLVGEEGVGALDPGRHRDTLNGGAGNDTLRGEDDHDFLIGGSGLDLLDGGDGNDDLRGQSGRDTLEGGGGVDTLRGGGDEDSLDGGNGGDLLIGEGGNDTLIGGFGSDTLRGGTGDDTFVFTNRANGQRDVLNDFQSGSDQIQLDFSVFSAVGFSVEASELAFGVRAQDADDFLIFDTASGRLRYDPDGDGAAAAVLIAIFTNGVMLSESDFFVS
ncbi:MAG: hypothetical protein AAGM84_14665 [Pseudomonadota bacterium]